MDERIELASYTGNATECVNGVIGRFGNLVTLNTFGTGYYSESNGALYHPLTVANAADGFWHSSLSFKKEGCIDMWIKLDGWSWANTNADDASQHRIFLDIGSKVWLYFHPGEGLHWTIVDDNSVFRRVSCTTCSLTAGTWYHISATWSALSGTMALYLNGTSIASGSVAPLTINGNTKMTIWWGKYGTDTDKGLRGYIDGILYRGYPVSFLSDRNDKRHGYDDVSLII